MSRGAGEPEEVTMTDRSRSIARLQFLGGQRIEIGSDVVTPEAERLFAMVVRLCVPLGRLVSRQTVMDTLWPGADEANARHNLRQTVYKARELGLVVESGEDGLRLDPRQWSCDWEDPVGDVPGEWLPDYDPLFSDDLRGWVTAQRVGVHASLRPRIVKSLQRARAAGELAAADAYARQLLSIDELNEEATMTRAELMAMQGSKVDALRLLDAYLAEVGSISRGREAAIPAHMLRKRIAEKLPALNYLARNAHFGQLEGRGPEAKHLSGALFETRAGRGKGILLSGATGSGKSRLIHETKKSALLQGMRTLEVECADAIITPPFSTLRAVVKQLLDSPGAAGVSPDELHSIRKWLVNTQGSPDSTPANEIEELFAAVSEETPLLLVINRSELSDRQSLELVDGLYRRGVPRYHSTVLESSVAAPPKAKPLALRNLDHVCLRQLSTMEVDRILRSYSEAAQPRATTAHISCAAVCSEGNPMYAIEMLGLLLDEGSPDTLPWRVQVAIANQVEEMTPLERRALLLCDIMSPLVRLDELKTALNADDVEFKSCVDSLEIHGALRIDAEAMSASPLLSRELRKHGGLTTLRLDCIALAKLLEGTLSATPDPTALFAILRLYVTANDESGASALLNRKAGVIFRCTTSTNLLEQTHRLSSIARGPQLRGLLKAIEERVRDGSEGHTGIVAHGEKTIPASLPRTGAPVQKSENSFTYEQSYKDAISLACNPEVAPEQRLAEAVAAMISADNLNNRDYLQKAHAAVVSVEDSPSVQTFDLVRARLIYAATSGSRDAAIAIAEDLATQSRECADIRLACQGLRNASSVVAHYGSIARAKHLAHESRELATKHNYTLQISHADVALADLAIHELDLAAAAAHIKHAQKSLSALPRGTRMISADINCAQCWFEIVRGDIPQAGKHYRGLVQSLGKGVSGTSRSTMLAARIATFNGTWNSRISNDLREVAIDVASRAFMPNEHRAVAALLLASKGRPEASIAGETYATYRTRCEGYGNRAWSFADALASEAGCGLLAV